MLPKHERFFASLSASALSPTAAVRGQSEHTEAHSPSIGGKRTCLKAAIGLGYNGMPPILAAAPIPSYIIIGVDWSILVATRSSVNPRQSIESDLSMTSVMAELLPDERSTEAQPASWLRGGMWGEEDLIEVCEIEVDIISEELCWWLDFSRDYVG